MAKKLRLNQKDMIFYITVYGLLLLISMTVILPFLYLLFSSFSTKVEYISRGFYIFPKEWTLNSYGYLLHNKSFIQSFLNTFYITIIGTAINVFITCLMAYSLSKKWLKGRSILNFMVLFTMIFNGGIIPTYMVVKELGLIDSYWSLFLSGAIGPFILIIMRSFFSNLPEELEEAARMDGCNEWRLLYKIVVPLSMPSIITISLMYGVTHWNAYFQAILYINSSSKWPVQVFLRQLLLETDSAMELNIGAFEYGPPVQMAAVIVTALPLLICYPFLQKYFNKGMLIGSVKG